MYSLPVSVIRIGVSESCNPSLSLSLVDLAIYLLELSKLDFKYDHSECLGRSNLCDKFLEMGFKGGKVLLLSFSDLVVLKKVIVGGCYFVLGVMQKVAFVQVTLPDKFAMLFKPVNLAPRRDRFPSPIAYASFQVI